MTIEGILKTAAFACAPALFFACGGLETLDQPPMGTDVHELEADSVCGQSQAREDAYWVEGSRIHFGADEVDVYGVSWFGLELPDRAPHGLWARSLDSYLVQLRDLGFTAIRVPVSPETIRPGFPSASWANRGDIDTGREQLEALIEGAGRAGLRVLLGFHTCNPQQIAGSLPGSPTNCPNYQLSDWLSDLRTLAELSNTYHPTVLGIDLVNEPHALPWGEWRMLAEQGGQAVLCTDPRTLVFVEGVGNASDSGGFAAFWGENLTEAAEQPVGLPPAKLVYSPHAYGPSVAAMDYFHAGDYPWNLPGIWDRHFGHLVDAGANVVIGEFGGRYDASVPGDVAWQDTFVDYLTSRNLTSFFYWVLNPNGGDTGGILLDDWTTPNTAKLNLLGRLMR